MNFSKQKYIKPKNPDTKYAHSAWSPYRLIIIRDIHAHTCITSLIGLLLQFVFDRQFFFFFFFFCVLEIFCPVIWDCSKHRLLFYRGVRSLPHNECPAYDTKQSDGEVPVMLELWGMWSTPSLPLLPGPLWPRVEAPDRVLSMG